MKRRHFLKITGIAPLAAGSSRLDALPQTQVSAIQHFRAAPFVGTAFLDGVLNLGAEAFADLTEEEADELAVAAFRQPGKIRTGVNAYLFQSDAETILVDAGGAGAMEPLGNLLPLLAEAGVKPEDVTKILLTHLHPDHIGGMIQNGEAVFPSASVHVHQADLDAWTTEQAVASAPADFHAFFQLARSVYLAYEDRIIPFTYDEELLPGVRTRHLPGHTPGHTGFEFGSGKDALLIWGDIVHVEAYQLPRPELTIGFDMDPKQARATRMQLLPKLVESQRRIAGMHLSFPGIGRLMPDGSGFRFLAEDWTFSLDPKKEGAA